MPIGVMEAEELPLMFGSVSPPLARPKEEVVAVGGSLTLGGDDVGDVVGHKAKEVERWQKDVDLA